MIFDIQKCTQHLYDTKRCPDDTDEWVSDVSIEVWTIHEKINFDKRLTEPIFHTLEFKGQMLLDPKKYTEQQMYMRQNKAESYEHLINFEHYDEYSFYDIAKIKKKVYPMSYNNNNDVEKGSMFQTVLHRDNVLVLHERSIYGFIDLLGDLGGVLEIVLLVFGLFLSPISEYSFNIKAIQKLYKAKTNEPSMFR